MTDSSPSIKLVIDPTDQLSPQEELEATKLNNFQVRLYKKYLVEALNELSNTRVIDGDFAAYSQTVSCLQGQIQVYQHLLDMHNTTKEME